MNNESVTAISVKAVRGIQKILSILSTLNNEIVKVKAENFANLALDSNFNPLYLTQFKEKKGKIG